MNIKKFTIENFRSLKRLSINTFGKTTIFYGENNAGKSNILNALQLIFARKSKIDYQNSLTPLENFYEGVILDSQTLYYNNETSSPIKFSVELEVLKSELLIDDIISSLFKTGTSFTFIFEGICNFEGGGEYDYSNFKIEKITLNNKVIYTNTDGYSFFPLFDKQLKKQADMAKAFARLIDIFNDCVYVVNSDRDMHETLMQNDSPKQLNPKTFKSFLYSLYLSPRRFGLFEQIDAVYSQPPFSFGTLSFSQDGDKLEIMVKEKNFRLPIKQLGSGALQALYIITCVIYSKSKIVCLEELEQNLSPKKQFETLRAIQKMIEDKKLFLNQLLISSHSSVYAKPKLGTIFFLEKVNGQTNIHKKETQTVSKELSHHLAPAAPGKWDESQMEEIKRILKEEHDFE